MGKPLVVPKGDEWKIYKLKHPRTSENALFMKCGASLYELTDVGAEKNSMLLNPKHGDGGSVLQDAFISVATPINELFFVLKVLYENSTRYLMPSYICELLNSESLEEDSSNDEADDGPFREGSIEPLLVRVADSLNGSYRFSQSKTLRCLERLTDRIVNNYDKVPKKLQRRLEAQLKPVSGEIRLVTESATAVNDTSTLSKSTSASVALSSSQLSSFAAQSSTLSIASTTSIQSANTITSEASAITSTTTMTTTTTTSASTSTSVTEDAFMILGKRRLAMELVATYLNGHLTKLFFESQDFSALDARISELENLRDQLEAQRKAMLKPGTLATKRKSEPVKSKRAPKVAKRNRSVMDMFKKA